MSRCGKRYTLQWRDDLASTVALFLCLPRFTCYECQEQCRSPFPAEDYGLASRLKQSHSQRAKSIQKFGQVWALFLIFETSAAFWPPFPPYTVCKRAMVLLRLRVMHRT